MSDAIDSVWVAARYDGERARSVMTHAHEGVGYFDIENIGTRTNPEIIVYFRQAVDGEPLAEHLAAVRDRYKITKLEKQRRNRTGSVDRPDIKRASDASIKRVRDIFFAKKKSIS